MKLARLASTGILALAAYGMLLGASAFAENGKPAETKSAVQKPEPGSPGDTLTREDARMALLVYKLLDKDGKIKGANIERGKKLFMQNCRPCHGDDGRRFNFSLYYEKPAFIGDRARRNAHLLAPDKLWRQGTWHGSLHRRVHVTGTHRHCRLCPNVAVITAAGGRYRP